MNSCSEKENPDGVYFMLYLISRSSHSHVVGPLLVSGLTEMVAISLGPVGVT